MSRADPCGKKRSRTPEGPNRTPITAAPVPSVSGASFSWAFNGRPLPGPPESVAADLEGSLRCMLVERGIRLLGETSAAAGSFGPRGSPYVAVKLSSNALLAVVAMPALYRCSGSEVRPCGCVPWWQSRTSTVEGFAQLVAEMAGLAPPGGHVIVAVPRAADCTAVAGAMAAVLQANPSLPAERLVACVAVVAAHTGTPALVTDCPPMMVAAAVRQTGFLVIGFNDQPTAVLCDDQAWDGAGLDCRVRDFLAPCVEPQGSPWLWAYSQRSGKHVTTGCCPALIARSLFEVARLEQCEDPTEATQPPGGKFPCLCESAGVLRLSAFDAERGVEVSAALVELIDDAAIGAGIHEVLVLVDPINPSSGAPTTFGNWLGPCKSSVLFVRTRVASLDLPNGYGLGPLGKWTETPCPSCLSVGQAGCRLAFVDAMERAIDDAPYSTGQSPSTRLPHNRLINGWLRFGCATSVFRPFDLQVQHGGLPMQVRWVLVDATETTRRPTRLVLVDARAYRMNSELAAVVAAQLGPCDPGTTVGILWCDSVLQHGLLENSTLRFV